eukprot:1243354-Heterocapsa_arctica.AAC.1
MGYAWLYNYKKDPGLAEFQDILNCLENGFLKIMMEEDPEKMTEADVEMPGENKEKSMMTEEVMKNIADFVSQNQKAELQRIEVRMEGIENSIAASKETTE